MNKEQFLAISLPHGLKGYVDGKGTISGQNIYILFNCPYMAATVEVMSTIVCESNFYTDKSKFKPILHPLTDLTKEVEHKGERFVPIEKLQEMNDGENIYIQDDFVGIDNGYACAYYLNDALKFVSVLIEWHFDIAGLIDKGEAIDVNTLPENTYK